MSIGVKDLYKKYYDKVAVNHISFTMEKGQPLAILGRNGSGKTVLFKCICGLLQINEGSILVDKKEYSDWLSS